MPGSEGREIIRRRNNVRELGNGQVPLLFAHGFGCDQTLWRAVAPAFATDFRVYLFDFVGSGRSDLSAWSQERYSSIGGYAMDLLEICEAFDLTDVVVVAHSVSANFAMQAAIDQPERFRHLILLGPSPCYLNDPPAYRGGFEASDLESLLDMMDRNFLGWANYLAPVVMGNRERPELAESLERTFCANDPVVARTFAEVTFQSDCRPLLPRVQVPTSILHIDEDPLVSHDVANFMHARLPLSALEVLPARGHVPHVSHPRETITAIRAALANPPRRGA